MKDATKRYLEWLARPRRRKPSTGYLPKPSPAPNKREHLRVETPHGEIER